MHNNTYASRPIQETRSLDVGLREHMGHVYQTMTFGMIITALTAWIVSALSMTTIEGQRQWTEFGMTLFNSPLKWVIAFAPLVVIIMAGAAMRRLSPAGLRMAFYGVAALIGVSMATLVLAFTGTSIAVTFFATAAGFAALSLFGYTTNKDLSRFGTFLIVGLIGLIIVMIANIFMQSPALAFAISVVGVLIFAGLTAYDTQRAKTQYVQMVSAGSPADEINKMATMSALSLYLDFINLFQFLLHFMGVRNE